LPVDYDYYSQGIANNMIVAGLNQSKKETELLILDNNFLNGLIEPAVDKKLSNF
jgi:hypothetical protein